MARIQDWISHGHNKCESGVLHATGYSSEVLDHVWQHYGDKLMLVLRLLI